MGDGGRGTVPFGDTVGDKAPAIKQTHTLGSILLCEGMLRHSEMEEKTRKEREKDRYTAKKLSLGD